MKLRSQMHDRREFAPDLAALTPINWLGVEEFGCHGPKIDDNKLDFVPKFEGKTDFKCKINF